MTPLVSVCITTYRHENYLRGTLDGILAQQVDFPYEILIHDDCSPDGTIAIIQEYAAKYPDIILPLYEEVNQYSQNIPINETFNFPRARGKYIALCEGDDCWIDPTKLARQIGYMETHEDCTFCFTNGRIRDVSGKKPDRDFLPYYPDDEAIVSGGSRNLTLSETVRLTFIPTASFVFRTDTLRTLPDIFRDHMTQYGDLRMKLFLSAAGYAHYEDVKAVMYRENVPTSAFQVWKKEKRKQVYERASTVVRLCKDVDDYSKGAAHEALEELKRYWLNVMAHNAPNMRSLVTGEVGKYWRSMPQGEHIRCIARLTMPVKLVEKLTCLGK